MVELCNEANDVEQLNGTARTNESLLDLNAGRYCNRDSIRESGCHEGSILGRLHSAHCKVTGKVKLTAALCCS